MKAGKVERSRVIISLSFIISSQQKKKKKQASLNVRMSRVLFTNNRLCSAGGDKRLLYVQPFKKKKKKVL